MVYYGLLVFFVFEYVRPNNFIPALNVLHLNSILPIGVVTATLASNGSISNTALLGETNIRTILAFLGLIGVSVLTADVTLYAYNTFIAVLGYVLIGVAIPKLITDVGQIKGVFRILVFVHIAVAMLTPEIFTDASVRHYLASGAFLGDGNDFALSVNLAIPFALFLVFEAETMRGRLFYTVVLLVLVLSVVGTSSRGGTLALAAVGLYYWLKSDKKVFTGFIVVVAIGIVFAVAPPMYFQRMQTITDQTEGSAQGRIMAWKSGVRMAIDHPFLGVGAGHFPVKYGVEYRPPDVGPTEIPWQTAHSIYFVILGELGFPGLFVLLFFIGYNLVANRRLAREVVARGEPNTATDVRLLACLSAGVIAFAVGGAFLTAIYYPHMYVLAGLLAAGRRIVRERHERPASSEHDLLGDVMPLPLGAR